MMMVMVLVILGRWRTDLGDEDGAVTEDGTDDALAKVLGTGELDDLGHCVFVFRFVVAVFDFSVECVKRSSSLCMTEEIKHVSSPTS